MCVFFFAPFLRLPPLLAGNGCFCSRGTRMSLPRGWSFFLFPPPAAHHAIGVIWAMRAHHWGWNAAASAPQMRAHSDRDVRTRSNAGGQLWPDCFRWDHSILKMEAQMLSVRRILRPSIIHGRTPDLLIRSCLCGPPPHFLLLATLKGKS